ncbi:MAG: hypothetical protein ACXWQQ_15510 [Pseudobdellovibrio sp.]
MKIFLICILFFAGAVYAKKTKSATNEETEKALSYLISVSANLPTKTSGCMDDARPDRFLRDFIAMELATFVNGKNKITGSCTGSKEENCKIFMTHSNGEDVSSAEFKFKVVSGQVAVESLNCLTTP